MRSFNFLWLSLIGAWTALLPTVACAQGSKPRSLYDGDSVKFQEAHFVKPRENTHFARAYLLAPLIIQEVKDGAGEAVPDKVYFQPGSIELNGTPHTQMTYWWNLGDSGRPHETGQVGGSTNTPDFAMGVRLTMDTNGVPEIYEVLGGNGTIRQIFVTQSLEAAAKAQFGPPVPGRRHSIELSLRESPDVVVPRILDDPPEAMGPFLYLQAGDHALATLICRCMNSQFRKLHGQGLYELVPATPSGDTSDATRLEAAIPRWLREDFSDQTNRLSRSLRLPTGF